MTGLPEVLLPDSIRDLGPVDVSPFEALLGRFSERFWEVEDARKENDFGVFHSTDHIILRFLREADDPRTFYDRGSWAVVEPRLRPSLDKIVAPYDFADPVYCKAMFARLQPHAVIDRHRDAARGNRLCHKIHVPVITSPSVWFEAGDRRRHLERGRAYEVNNVDPHSAGNNSDEPRVHFIFEVYDGANS